MDIEEIVRELDERAVPEASVVLVLLGVIQEVDGLPLALHRINEYLDGCGDEPITLLQVSTLKVSKK